MKKLSEIGRMSAGYKATRTEDGKDVSWGACKEFIYSEAERRELLKEFVDRWSCRVDLGQTFEQFLEEQGL